MQKLAYLIVALLVMQLLGLAMIYKQQHELASLKAAYADLLENVRRPKRLPEKVEDSHQGDASKDVVSETLVNQARVAHDQNRLHSVSTDDARAETQALREKISYSLARFGFSAFDSQQIADIELDAIASYQKLLASGSTTASQDMHLLMQDTMETMRDLLGEFGYQAYLEAKSLPTAVKVSGVSQRSNAGAAGLRVGDQIERYDGERVYNIFELNRRVQSAANDGYASMRTVHYRRDGSLYTVELPQGMMGISAMPIRPRTFFETF